MDDRDAFAAGLLQPYHRKYTAEDYWPVLRRHLIEFGISRVSDITGLDKIGVPVVQVCRPDARSNAVTQGKGMTLASAAVGAVLESLEMAAGEAGHVGRPWREPISEPNRIRWASLGDGSDLWPPGATGWVRGRNLNDQTDAPVPKALLSTDYTCGSAAESAPVLRSSIGLCAGATMAEAARHGILECIEADARIRALASPGTLDQRQICLPDVSGLPLVARLAEPGLRVGAWNMTCRSGPQCVMVRVTENPEVSSGLRLPADGFACRVDMREALEDALLEALQARLAVISGAREDMTWSLYNVQVKNEDLLEEWERLHPSRGRTEKTITARDLSTHDLVSRLEDAGLGPVLIVPLLERPDIPLCVSRVLIPGLVSDPQQLTQGAF